MKRPSRPLLVTLCAALVACGSDYTRPVLSAPHVLTGSWIGSTTDYSLTMNLAVRDSGRSDPSGIVPSKFVRGSGRYSIHATGAETTFVVPPYEVRFQQSLEPMTLRLWSYELPNGTLRSFEFRGVVLNSNRLSGWLVRTQVLPSSAVTLDSVTLIVMRDGT